MKLLLIHVSWLWGELLGRPGKDVSADEAARAGASAAARLPGLLAALAEGHDRVLLALDRGHGWRRELDPAHDERHVRWPDAAWAPLDDTVLGPCSVCGEPSSAHRPGTGSCSRYNRRRDAFPIVEPPPYPAGAPLALGDDAVSLAGRRGSARDVIATIARWHEQRPCAKCGAIPSHGLMGDVVGDGDGCFEPPPALRIVSGRSSLAALVSDSAGIELVRSVRDDGERGWSYTVAHEAEVRAALGDPRQLADRRALVSVRAVLLAAAPESERAALARALGGIGDGPRAKVAGGPKLPSTVDALLAAHGDARTVVEMAALCRAGDKLPGFGLTVPQMATLRAAAAHGGAGILRALALAGARDDVPLDVAALMGEKPQEARGDADAVRRDRGAGGATGDAPERSAVVALSPVDVRASDGAHEQSEAAAARPAPTASAGGHEGQEERPPHPVAPSARAAQHRPTPAVSFRGPDGETPAERRERLDALSDAPPDPAIVAEAQAAFRVREGSAPPPSSTAIPSPTTEETRAMSTEQQPQRQTAEAPAPEEPAQEAPVVEPETPAETAARAAEWARMPPPPNAAAPPSAIGVDPSSAEWALSLQPKDAADAYRMARAFHASGLYSKKFNSPDAIWTVILLGREYGLSALAALQSLTIIEGKVEMDAALIVAKVLRSGAAAYFRLVESTDESATWETQRLGDKPIKMSFGVKDAQRRGLFVVQRDGTRTTSGGKQTNWQKMPDVMCMWRAATKLARAIYPDVTRGLYGQGEIRETRLEGEIEAVAEQAIAARDAAKGRAA